VWAFAFASFKDIQGARPVLLGQWDVGRKESSHAGTWLTKHPIMRGVSI